MGLVKVSPRIAPTEAFSSKLCVRLNGPNDLPSVMMTHEIDLADPERSVSFSIRQILRQWQQPQIP
jgi:hypothetical protein